MLTWIKTPTGLIVSALVLLVVGIIVGRMTSSVDIPFIKMASGGETGRTNVPAGKKSCGSCGGYNILVAVGESCYGWQRACD